jgi:hypothetical protein
MSTSYVILDGKAIPHSELLEKLPPELFVTAITPWILVAHPTGQPLVAPVKAGDVTTEAPWMFTTEALAKEAEKKFNALPESQRNNLHVTVTQILIQTT